MFSSVLFILDLYYSFSTDALTKCEWDINLRRYAIVVTKSVITKITNDVKINNTLLINLK